MRTRTAKWFETKIKYDKMVDADGLMKPIKELYVLDALSFSDAEASIMEEMRAYISGAFDIVDIKPASYKEIFFSEDTSDDRWYKAKLQFITIDEKTEKEKRQNVYYLVQASTLFKAVKNIDEVMGKTMIDYAIASVAETTVMDVFEHEAKLEGEKNDVPEYEEQAKQ